MKTVILKRSCRSRIVAIVLLLSVNTAETLAGTVVEVQEQDSVFVSLTPVEIEGVEVRERRAGATIDRMSVMNVTNISSDELCRAPCCNLGESFETNASVDVAYSDATTGAKTIQLLGLSGKYVQMMTENVPNLRSLAQPYSLDFVPGPWMAGIQVSKGVGTVVNGYEAFTGQINIEYKKPVSLEVASANIFASSHGRLEANASTNIHVHDRLRTAILLSGSIDTKSMDSNDDNFRDEPKKQQINILNRWNYSNGNGYTFQIIAKFLHEDRLGGEINFHKSSPSQDIYGVRIKTDRVETWMKNGFYFNDNSSLGTIVSYMYHKQNSFFGLKTYDAIEHSYSINLIFQTGNDSHKLHTGLSSQGDFIDESIYVNDEIKNKFQDVSAGIFAQYTFILPDIITIIAGVRADYNNNFDVFFTPRFHLKFTPDEKTTLRLCAGQGRRTAMIFAENNSLLTSSREWIFNDTFAQEKGWNCGVSATRYFDIFGRELMLSAEYYRTQFQRQMIANFDISPRFLSFDLVHGHSFSNTLQVEAKILPVRGLEISAAYRLNDAKETLNEQLRSRPLTSKYKGLLAVSYATPLKKWQFDANIHFNGKGRIPSTSDNPENYQRPETFRSYQTYNVQITKFFRTWNIYVGCENIGNFTQKNPIIVPDDPFGNYFDATQIWGPLMMRKFFLGLRWSLEK